jgi:hypothetical protein
MRDYWSVNALSLELGPDRRSIAKWLSRADTKPVATGPKDAPLYKLADAVGVLADANLLGNRERFTLWGTYHYQEIAAREFAGSAMRALAKRLPEDALRAAREVLADELLHYLEECEAGMRGRRFKRGESPPWTSMSDRELVRALRGLVQTGCMEDAGDEEGDAACRAPLPCAWPE